MMKIHKFLRQRKTDASPFRGVGLIDTIESVEDVGKMLGGDAGAGVGDGDLQEVTPLTPPLFSAERGDGRVSCTVTTPPSAVNFNAFDVRLLTIFSILSASK